MTNTPKSVYKSQIRKVYEAENCALRLVDAETEILDSKMYQPEDKAKSGFVEWRFLRRVSRDGRCILLADVFIDEHGIEHLDIVILEIDGQEHLALYDEPKQPFEDEDEL